MTFETDAKGQAILRRGSSVRPAPSPAPALPTIAEPFAVPHVGPAKTQADCAKCGRPFCPTNALSGRQRSDRVRASSKWMRSSAGSSTKTPVLVSSSSSTKPQLTPSKRRLIAANGSTGRRISTPEPDDGALGHWSNRRAPARATAPRLEAEFEPTRVRVAGARRTRGDR